MKQEEQKNSPWEEPKPRQSAVRPVSEGHRR